MKNNLINFNRRRGLLAATATLLSLPACSETVDEQRQRAGLPPLTEEQKRMRKKFKGLKGGQLVVDAFGEKEAVTIFHESGRVFYTRGVVSPRNQSIYAYGAEFGVPLSLRAMWRRENAEVNGIVQSPIRITELRGIYEGGTIAGDYTVPVAERIPDDLLAELRRNKYVGFRLKLRLHDDGLLVGWDLASPVDRIHVGGDFQEAHIVYFGDPNNMSRRFEKGWYIHPKTGERIETDF